MGLRVMLKNKIVTAALKAKASTFEVMKFDLKPNAWR